MSSVTWSIPSCVASSVASCRLIGSLSRSGRKSPNTCLGPSALTASAAQVELSIPPLIATTSPRRRSWLPSWARSSALIRSTASAAFSRRRSPLFVMTTASAWNMPHHRYGLPLEGDSAHTHAAGSVAKSLHLLVARRGKLREPAVAVRGALRCPGCDARARAGDQLRCGAGARGGRGRGPGGYRGRARGPRRRPAEARSGRGGESIRHTRSRCDCRPGQQTLPTPPDRVCRTALWLPRADHLHGPAGGAHAPARHRRTHPRRRPSAGVRELRAGPALSAGSRSDHLHVRIDGSTEGRPVESRKPLGRR